MRRCALISVLMILEQAGMLSAAEDRALEGREDVTTAKERLVNKAADPQRVDDCKVPAEKQDTDRRRPSDCPHLERGDDDRAEDTDG